MCVFKHREGPLLLFKHKSQSQIHRRNKHAFTSAESDALCNHTWKIKMYAFKKLLILWKTASGRAVSKTEIDGGKIYSHRGT